VCAIGDGGCGCGCGEYGADAGAECIVDSGCGGCAWVGAFEVAVGGGMAGWGCDSHRHNDCCEFEEDPTFCEVVDEEFPFGSKNRDQLAGFTKGG